MPSAYPLTELSSFQRDLLAVISREERPIGVELKEELEKYYDNVSSGLLYPNLDQLAEDALIRKAERDGRSHYYYLTDPGREVFLADLAFREDAAGFYQPSLDELDDALESIDPRLETALDRVVEAGLAVRICRGTKMDGSRCGRRVKAGGYCHLHEDQAEEDAEDDPLERLYVSADEEGN